MIDRYNDLRSRLRISQPAIADATGYSIGYVRRWGHSGASALTPPARAIERLEALWRDRVLRDYAEIEEDLAVR